MPPDIIKAPCIVDLRGFSTNYVGTFLPALRLKKYQLYSPEVGLQAPFYNYCYNTWVIPALGAGGVSSDYWYSGYVSIPLLLYSSSFQVMPGMKFVPFYIPSIVFVFFDFLFEFVLQVLLIFQLLFSNWSAPHFLKWMYAGILTLREGAWLSFFFFSMGIMVFIFTYTGNWLTGMHLTKVFKHLYLNTKFIIIRGNY